MIKRLILSTTVTLLSSQSYASAFTAAYGSFLEETKTYPLYILEFELNKQSFFDFEANSINHSDSLTINDSAELVYQGIGFDFEPFRLNLELGFFFSLDKLVLDEVDYGVSRSIGGLRLSSDLGFINFEGSSRSYRPSWSPKTKIDSFTISYNPSPYQLSQAKIGVKLMKIRFVAEAGRFDHLKGRFDIMDQQYTVDQDPISYASIGLTFLGQKNTAIRLEWHDFIEDHDSQKKFHKLIGSALHRDAFHGGLLALGVEF
ncbi:MAG: hypothetical protein NTX25_23915 [Proteobacteria bacterium]|nr:hypothetical protein [Pseudomonadota bacterium]